MDIRMIQAAMEAVTDTMEQLPPYLEIGKIQMTETLYDIVVSVELLPGAKPGEALEDAAMYLREKIVSGAPDSGRPSVLHSEGDVFFEFFEYVDDQAVSV